MANNIYHVTYGDIGTGLVINDGVAVPANKDKIEVSPDYLKRTGDTADDLKVTKVASDARDVLALEDGREIFEPKKESTYTVYPYVMFKVGEWNKTTQPAFQLAVGDCFGSNFAKFVEWSGPNGTLRAMINTPTVIPETVYIHVFASKTNPNIYEIWAQETLNGTSTNYSVYLISGTPPTLSNIDVSYFQQPTNYLIGDYTTGKTFSDNTIDPARNVATEATKISSGVQNMKVTIAKNVISNQCLVASAQVIWAKFDGSSWSATSHWIVQEDANNYYLYLSSANVVEAIGNNSSDFIVQGGITPPNQTTIATPGSGNVGTPISLSTANISVKDFAEVWCRRYKAIGFSDGNQQPISFNVNTQNAFGVSAHSYINLRSATTQTSTTYTCTGTYKEYKTQSSGLMNSFLMTAVNYRYNSLLDGEIVYSEYWERVVTNITSLYEMEDEGKTDLVQDMKPWESVVGGQPVPQAVLDAYRVRPPAGSTALSSEIISNVGGNYSTYSAGLTEYKDSELYITPSGTAINSSSVINLKRDGNFVILTVNIKGNDVAIQPKTLLSTIPSGYRPKDGLLDEYYFTIGTPPKELIAGSALIVDTFGQILWNGDNTNVIASSDYLSGSITYPAEK